ncbi:unnamed protein product [Adineta steineri]|uniref:Arrestin C-terminal-like domain-containing protein n=1 Tax=Adineta steineri TaxID=433720 RepID=A0A818SRB1_9BILA|nr:unnamed protein product [Adineta steineri]CAF3674408.1 unnamed protein product [Adineta steineri]
MGNNNSSINVTLDQAQPAIYIAGDVISGQVHFNITERTKKTDEIYLSLTGDIGYTTTRTVRMQNGQMERKTDCHNVRILGQKFLLGNPTVVKQTHHELFHHHNNDNHDASTLEPGQYTYPFSIRLPDDLPPTLHPEDYPFVRYQLQVLLEKKWYHSNDRHRYPIRIFPRVNLYNISNSQSAVKFGTKRKDVTVKGVLQHAGLIPGEQTILTLDIQNPNRVTIKRVDACFIQRYDIEQCRRRLELVRLPVAELANNQDQHIEVTCPLVIPLGIPPSFSYRSNGIRSIVHVDLHYDLKLEIKAKGLFTDFDLQVPVIIGTTENSNYNTRSTTVDTMNMVALDFTDDDMPPPPYDSIHNSGTSTRS